ncbi:hypothetical protein EJB05_08390 [Eragrostis curvula]|uniref:F-box domain-containing protein n=1 Tax=Eragrostis curvula TaxID=38414 RepID=A0A5J9W0Q6_9POAL|nr:hypothetical protein EJB05_08390 [Eragrostis curvula]
MPRRSPPATTEQEPLIGHSMSEMLAGLQQDLGMDNPDLLLMATGGMLELMYDAIPDPPVSPAARLASAVARRSPADGVDRISCLPNQILRNVVSRLRAKDAARTGALARRWRGLWCSAPIVLVDEHVLSDRLPAGRMAPGGDDVVSKAVVAAVSRALAAHQGPIRSFHLTRGHMASHEAEAERWLKLLAAKGVQELVFFNHPWPLDFPLPAAAFSCVSVTHLQLGVWMLPDTAVLPRNTRFPHLRDLVLSFILMRDHDLAFFVEKSPVLENLTIIGSQLDERLRLVSRSLRCVQLGMFKGNVAVVDAPRLERLLLWMALNRRKERSRIKIGHAPNLRMLGYWQPAEHELEIGSTVIKESTKVRPSTIVPTVRMLALEVQFEVCNDVKMVPCFLECFPNVETLHVYSQNAEPTGKLDIMFWQEAGPIECVHSHVKKFVFQQFRGKRSELMFLKFIAERAQVLKKMFVMMALESFSSEDDMKAKMKLLAMVKWASKDCMLIFVMNPGYPATAQGSPSWSFHKASDFSCMDPFDLRTIENESWVFHHTSSPVSYKV